jgi:hypothetical protein
MNLSHHIGAEVDLAMEGANIIMAENMNPALLAVVIVASMGFVIWAFVAVNAWLLGISATQQKKVA